MTYDAQNRMTLAQYADSGSVTHRNEYSYAGNSLLAELKKYDAGALTNTTKYLRSGFLPIQERDASNTVSREYTWGLNLGGGIGGLLNLRQGGADYSYLYDGKGNVSALIDSLSNLVASYAYDPFGQLMKKSGTLDQPYTFSTKEYDSRTGLNYYGYRFYDSCSGRWTTRDPLGEAGGVNLYLAVGNNAVNWFDPQGLEGCGPGKIGDWFVPDLPGGSYFKYACDKHDACYSKADMAAGKTKEQCDKEFRNKLFLSCLIMPGNPSCIPMAYSYYLAVARYGDDSFNRARSSCKANK